MSAPWERRAFLPNDSTFSPLGRVFARLELRGPRRRGIGVGRPLASRPPIPPTWGKKKFEYLLKCYKGANWPPKHENGTFCDSKMAVNG